MSETELEKELRNGLEGVTPGPWYAFIKNGVVSLMKASGYKKGEEIIAWTGFDASAFQRACTANVRHIARCHPGNIAKLLDALSTERAAREKAERERDASIAARNDFARDWDAAHKRAEAAEAEASRLREALECAVTETARKCAGVARMREFVEFVKNAPVSSGVCCCGDHMDRHPDPMSCGHTPVDQWHHSLDGWLADLAAIHTAFNLEPASPLGDRT